MINYSNQITQNQSLDDSNPINKSSEIKKSFVSLDENQKKILIKKLSSKERLFLIKIIENGDTATVGNDTKTKLNNNIKYIKNQKNSSQITLENDSILRGKFNFIFNFISAYKTNEIIEGIFHKEKTEIANQNLGKIASLMNQARQEVPAGEKINLAELLKKNGLSTEIQDIVFPNDANSPNYISFKDVHLEGITFNNCQFNWMQSTNATFNEVVFINCNLSNFSFANASLQNTHILHCKLEEVMFTAAKIENVNFVDSHLTNTSFEDASLESCRFINSSLPGTHFLETTIQNCIIDNCKLKDTIFFGTLDQFKVDEKSKKSAVVTRPTTALLINPEVPGITTPKVNKKLRENANTIVLRITMQPQKVTKESINREVEEALGKVGSYDQTSTPIPQRLIKQLAENPTSDCAQILRKSEKLATQVDSIMLPGGEDIPPALYGAEAKSQTDWGGDYRRSILEISLIHQSFTKGIPLMAVCRGFQMSNIYFGAQLVQHVEGHKTRYQEYSLNTEEKSGLYAQVMKNNIMGRCCHHQAVPNTTGFGGGAKPTEHLETSVLYGDWVKASEAKAGGSSPMILLQFHPEFYKGGVGEYKVTIQEKTDKQMSAENEMFWKILSDSANAHRVKKMALPKIFIPETITTEVQQKRLAREEKLNALEQKQQLKLLEVIKKTSFKTEDNIGNVDRLSRLIESKRANLLPGQKINLTEILRQEGYSNVIKDLKFSKDFSFKDVLLDGINFTNCEFDYSPCTNASFIDVVFNKCKMANFSFVNASLESTRFEDCNMQEVMFTGAELDHVDFLRSTLTNNSFEDASLKNSRFINSSLPGTHFLEASIKDSIIDKCNLKDTIFFGTLDQFKTDEASKRTAIVTRPTTAILLNPEEAGCTTPKVNQKLKETTSTIVLRIALQSQKVSKENINREVEDFLKVVGPYDKKQAPIPQRLIKEIANNQNSESAKILRKSQKLASQVDSIFLPGGEDVPPALYGEEAEMKTSWGGDYRRSLLEIGLIHQSFTKGIPLMAVCRGFQISNVYFGAQLIQDIQGHNGVFQNFNLNKSEKEGLYRDVMKDTLISVCCHHQAVPDGSMDKGGNTPTEHLEAAVSYEGLIKAAEAKLPGASPMILLQFHPEFYKVDNDGRNNQDLIDAKMSPQNEMFWTMLSNSAEAYRIKKIAIEQIKKFDIKQLKTHKKLDINNLVPSQEVRLVAPINQIVHKSMKPVSIDEIVGEGVESNKLGIKQDGNRIKFGENLTVSGRILKKGETRKIRWYQTNLTVLKINQGDGDELNLLVNKNSFKKNLKAIGIDSGTLDAALNQGEINQQLWNRIEPLRGA